LRNDTSDWASNFYFEAYLWPLPTTGLSASLIVGQPEHKAENNNCRMRGSDSDSEALIPTVSPVVLLCIARIARFRRVYEQADLTARFGDGRRNSLMPDSERRTTTLGVDECLTKIVQCSGWNPSMAANLGLIIDGAYVALFECDSVTNRLSERLACACRRCGVSTSFIVT
jgi:hypothetical protein